MDRVSFSQAYLKRVSAVLATLDANDIAAAFAIIETAYTADRQVFLAGNGGSAATASHMANDLMKTIVKKTGKGMKAICLSDNIALMTAVANDISYDQIFCYPLQSLAQKDDVLVLISGSGNSKNLLEAATAAKKLGVKTIGFLGMDGGALKAMVDAAIVVPSDDYGPIEDTHMILNHLVTAYLRDSQ